MIPVPAANPLTDDEQKCIDAIFLTHSRIERDSLVEQKGTRTAGTCEWIRGHPIFRQWQTGVKPLLWISGSPGKGKTMAAIYITELLESSGQPSQDSRLAFFFCNNQDEKRNSAVAMLRGLLWSIIAEDSRLIKHALPFFKNQALRESSPNSFATLWKIFEAVCRDGRLKRLLCVIDGLDECDESSRRHLLARITSHFGTSQGTSLRLIILSRKVRGLHSYERIRLDPDQDDQIASDIGLFVQEKVAELGLIIDGFSEIAGLVTHNLTEKAGSTFLWVGFAMQELIKKTTCTEIIETLDALPRDLSDMYGRMLHQIKENHRDVAALILRWTALSARPLTLEELAVAIEIVPPHSLGLRQYIRDQVAHCGHLLKIDEGRHFSLITTAKLVHQSAWDYLVRADHDDDAVLETFRIRSEQAHGQMAERCLRLLLSKSCRELHLSPAFSKRSPAYPEPAFLEYASTYWSHHVRHSGELAQKQLSLLSSFLSIGNHISRRWIPYCTQHYSIMANPRVPLEAAVHLGLFPWAPESVSTSIEDRIEHEISTSFFLAVKGGYVAMAELLLSRNPDLRYSDELGGTAFDHAAGIGAHKLLEKMYRSDTQTRFCAYNGAPRRNENWFIKVTNLMLGYDMEKKFRKARSTDPDALFISLLGPSARDLVLERLWDDSGLTKAICPGSDTEFAGAERLQGLRQCLEQEILLAAIHDFREKDRILHGCNRVIRTLLAAGANPNAQDCTGRTALHEALRLGEHDIVLQLSRADRFNPNVREYNGNTALHEAFTAGRLDDVKLLLRIPSLDPDQQDKDGRTALFVCAVCGYADIFKTLLMDCHADPDIATNLGFTVWNWPLKSLEISSMLECDSRGRERKRENSEDCLFPS
ncbi:hypothetical protein BDV97DRAFT_364708 [Delphinella strobiligena]|nr:hypothetical protein BDV97DRAFT_364708 [Delphinella strobiligena]